jgi:16S rRNA (cytidine1402-2'-O)-methyltransferase
MVEAESASLGREMERRSDEAAAYPAIAGTESWPAEASENDGRGGPAPGQEESARSQSGRSGADGAGTLTVAAVPIGQPADASGRLAPALATAGVIAAEDTRRLRRLAGALGVTVTGRVVSYYDDVEARRVPGLLAELAAGQDVLLVTDAGMPGVSDPGYRLVAAAAAAGIKVTALPGPSAVTAALAVSGLPSDRFAFEGFPPRRAGDRARRFAELAGERRTLVFFESPRRVARTLAELAGAFGPDRRAAICRELTKTHEEIIRGTLGELANRAEGGLLGEITLVVAGAQTRVVTTHPAQAAALVAGREAAGLPRKEAIAAVAKELGLPRREVYDAVVTARRASR